jgi:hypothetical protein
MVEKIQFYRYLSVRTYGLIYSTTTIKYSLYARGSTYIRTLSLRTKREGSNQEVVNRTTLIAHLQSYAFGRTYPIPGQPTVSPMFLTRSVSQPKIAIMARQSPYFLAYSYCTRA